MGLFWVCDKPGMGLSWVRRGLRWICAVLGMSLSWVRCWDGLRNMDINLQTVSPRGTV